MKIVVLLFLSHFFFSAPALQDGVDSFGASIWGRVIDESSGRPVAGAIVYAISGSQIRQATSSRNGRFLFLSLLPQNYRLCASKAGYTLDCDYGEAEELFAGVDYSATVVLAPNTGAHEQLGRGLDLRDPFADEYAH